MKKTYLIKNPIYFQGEKYLNTNENYFEGWYFKNINDKKGIAFIPGININKEEKKEDDEFVIRRNTSEHTGFNYVDLFFVAAIGMLLIAAVVGVVAIMLFRSKKDYDTSNEAISAKQEKERKQRLKAIKDAEQKAEKEKKKNKKGK